MWKQLVNWVMGREAGNNFEVFTGKSLLCHEWTLKR
jgi:hypothetical protein